MGLLNSNSLNEWAMGFPDRARQMYASLLDAPRQVRQLFDPQFQQGLLATAKPEFDRQKAMALALDVMPGGVVGSIKKVFPKTQYEIAHEVASKNAENLLGLPPGNTAVDRANAMGAIDYYHGTERLDRFLEKKGLNPKRATSGPMPFGTPANELASTYSMGKQDTSRLLNDEGNVANYFQVSPKSLGWRGTSPYSVEQTWYFLPQEIKKDILDKATRVGYENLDDFTGRFVLHPSGTDATLSMNKYEWDLKNQYKGNPLSALRDMWHDSGELINNPESLADIYKLAGYPHEILQNNAPWYEAKGIFTGKAMMKNPLDTSDVAKIQDEVLPKLKEMFKGDRTRIKNNGYGVDLWDKNTRFTPKEWLTQLEADLSSGKNSYVYTSIPDKITEGLKKLGYDGIMDKAGKGGGQMHDVVIPFYPNQVRSKFAAFDPAKSDSTDLLAGLAPYLGIGGLLGLGLTGKEEDYSQ